MSLLVQLWIALSMLRAPVPRVTRAMILLANVPDCEARGGGFPMWFDGKWECDDWGSLGVETPEQARRALRWSMQ